jgi:hypothetical protein
MLRERRMEKSEVLEECKETGKGVENGGDGRDGDRNAEEEELPNLEEVRQWLFA